MTSASGDPHDHRVRPWSELDGWGRLVEIRSAASAALLRDLVTAEPHVRWAALFVMATRRERELGRRWLAAAGLAARPVDPKREVAAGHIDQISGRGCVGLLLGAPAYVGLRLSGRKTEVLAVRLRSGRSS